MTVICFSKNFLIGIFIDHMVFFFPFLFGILIFCFYLFVCCGFFFILFCFVFIFYFPCFFCWLTNSLTSSLLIIRFLFALICIFFYILLLFEKSNYRCISCSMCGQGGRERKFNYSYIPFFRGLRRENFPHLFIFSLYIFWV